MRERTKGVPTTHGCWRTNAGEASKNTAREVPKTTGESHKRISMRFLWSEWFPVALRGSRKANCAFLSRVEEHRTSLSFFPRAHQVTAWRYKLVAFTKMPGWIIKSSNHLRWKGPLKMIWSKSLAGNRGAGHAIQGVQGEKGCSTCVEIRQPSWFYYS